MTCNLTKMHTAGLLCAEKGKAKEEGGCTMTIIDNIVVVVCFIGILLVGYYFSKT